jgi:hypothetical protein
VQKALIEKIQALRESKLIAYVTGDRQPVASKIAEDVVRPLYDHLLKLGKTHRIDLFLYSRGGDVSVPWRIISTFREFCDELCVLVPYKAHSAATMITLGADSVVMGRKAELSPIDPTMTKAGQTGDAPQEISVEDVNSYVSFIKDRANINDQLAVAQMMSLLANEINPLTLGSINRNNSHIRLVARKLLMSRNDKSDEAKINAIIETLTEKMYSHGHAIARKEALEIGLPVVFPEDELETALWELYRGYERFLNLADPVDMLGLLEGKEETNEHLSVAVIESENDTQVFSYDLTVKRKRAVPPNPQISVNLQLGLPANINPADVPGNIQQVLQEILQEAAKQIPGLVTEELTRQSPDIGIEMKSTSGAWKQHNEEI